jgi:hypothetical protein
MTREVYIGKDVVLSNKKFNADEFYFVSDSLALVIVSSGCGVYADDDKTQLEGENNVSFYTQAN